MDALTLIHEQERATEDSIRENHAMNNSNNSNGMGVPFIIVIIALLLVKMAFSGGNKD